MGKRIVVAEILKTKKTDLIPIIDVGVNIDFEKVTKLSQIESKDTPYPLYALAKIPSLFGGYTFVFECSEKNLFSLNSRNEVIEGAFDKALEERIPLVVYKEATKLKSGIFDIWKLARFE